MPGESGRWVAGCPGAGACRSILARQEKLRKPTAYARSAPQPQLTLFTPKCDHPRCSFNTWSHAWVRVRIRLLSSYLQEYCDRGSLLSAIKRGVFRMDDGNAGAPAADAAAATPQPASAPTGSQRFPRRIVLRAVLRSARDVAQVGGTVRVVASPINDRRGLVRVSDSLMLHLPRDSRRERVCGIVIRSRPPVFLFSP